MSWAPFCSSRLVALRALGVPVLEVGVPAVGHEVAAPAGLDLADGALVDQRLHLLDDAHVAHVVAEVELEAALAGGAQDAVAALDGDGHRLLEVDGLAGLQGGDGVLLVEEVRRGDEDGVDVLAREQLAVVGGDEGVRAVLLLEALQRGRHDVRPGHQPHALLRLVRVRGQPAAPARPDNADPQFLRRSHASLFLLEWTNRWRKQRAGYRGGGAVSTTVAGEGP